MKFLLTAINAKYIHSNLAVYDIKAYAEKYGEGIDEGEIEIAEYTINHQWSDILKELYQKNPDVIGFSCYIWNIRMVEELMTELKKILPQVEIWLGGPEVSYCAEQILERFPFVRGVMIGEGEKTFLSLVNYYKKKQDKMSNIAGLCYRKNDPENGESMICKTTLPQVMDLSEIPFPYQKIEQFSNRIIYYESSRGCPFSCSYCLSSIEKKLRFRDLELVKQELQFFLDKKVPQVKFVDRTFNCKKSHAMEIWRYLLEHDNGVTNFHFEISADLLSEDELKLMRQMRVGLIQLEIGVQSTNPETLSAIHRKTDLIHLKRNVAEIKAMKNIHQHLDLIAGLPYEDYESFQTSFNEVYEMQPDQLQLGFLKVLSGTDMSDSSLKYGIVCQDNPPYEVLYTRWLPYGDVLKLKGVEEMVELYYNSTQFVTSIRFLRQFFKTPFQMYERLAEFYAKHHAIGEKSSRIARYELLLDFAKDILSKLDLEKFKETLIYDVYLRENIKTRPSFAKETEKSKEILKEFCIKEEKERKYLSGYETCNSRQIANLIHIERFYYNPLDREGAGEYDILFDYRNRNPLTKDASTIILSST